MNATTTPTISVTDTPLTPLRPEQMTNYLVRVQYEYEIQDYLLFGPVGMIKSELRSLIKERYPRDEATTIVNAVSL